MQASRELADDILGQVSSPFRTALPALAGATAAIALAAAMAVMPHSSSMPETSDAYLPGVVVPGTDEGLRSLRAPLTRERFYFVMTDRFANGDPSNDRGGIEGERNDHGFDPTDKGFYQGGDLRGVIDNLDYIEGLGTTTIWLTPAFVNKPVQGPSEDESAGYHGYWITDFTRIDPHLGTNEEMTELIDAAHARGMKVFFDIITNHTADVIAYEEGEYSYRSKADHPYEDAAGNAFDDKDHVGNPFPELDPDTFAAYTPVFGEPGDESVKVPEWLNDVTMYHNRGDSTFEGESSEYGDFFGLDDLFTERTEVVEGMTEIYKTWLDFGIDGFRIDTVKHVNIEFWQEFSRGILEYADEIGKDDFFMFGEVYTASPLEASRYTTEGLLPAVLDFGFQSAAASWLRMGSSEDLAQILLNDDVYLSPHSNAYSMPTFLGNHDMGRIAMMTKGLGGGDERWLERVKLGHTLMYLVRGQPVVYYGDEQGLAGSGGDKDARQSLFATQTEQYADEVVLGGPSGSIDRYDTDHPLYQHISALAALREEHPALADGIFQLTGPSAGPGPITFSRVDRDSHVEYVVALNNTTDPVEQTVAVFTRDVGFTSVWGDHPDVRSDKRAVLSLTVPPTGAVVLMADKPVPVPDEMPEVRFIGAGSPSSTAGSRLWTGVEVGGDHPVPIDVTFQRRVGDGVWELLGVDDNAPYSFWDTPASDRVQYRVIARDLGGGTRTIESDWVSAAVVEDGVTVTAPGSYQDEIGCREDWSAECDYSLLADPDGDGVYTWTTTDIPAGSWEFKIAIDFSWEENYGAGGAPDGDNVTLVVPEEGASVRISYDRSSHEVTADVG